MGIVYVQWFEVHNTTLSCYNFHNRVPLQTQATEHTPKEYRERTTMATMFEAYMVDMDKFIKPVNTFAFNIN